MIFRKPRGKVLWAQIGFANQLTLVMCFIHILVTRSPCREKNVHCPHRSPPFHAVPLFTLFYKRKLAWTMAYGLLQWCPYENVRGLGSITNYAYACDCRNFDFGWTFNTLSMEEFSFVFFIFYFLSLISFKIMVNIVVHSIEFICAQEMSGCTLLIHQ